MIAVFGQDRAPLVSVPMSDPFAHCEALVRAGDRDRWLATLFAPAEKRPALFALYAFDLEIAQVRARAHGAMPGEIRLQWWRDALVGEARGDVSANPVAAALRETIGRFELPVEPLLTLIDARTFDLYDDPMPDIGALRRYAEDTEGAISALSATALDLISAKNAAPMLRSISVASVVSGIVRGLPIQAARGQCYLPADVLVRHGLSAADVMGRNASPALRAALDELRLLASAELEAVGGRVDDCPPLRPGLLPAVLIRPVLTATTKSSYDPFAPPELPAWRRQWRLWRAARRGLAPYL